MKKNVGQLDRIIRIILGIALLVLFFVLEGALRWSSLVVGIIFLLTGIIRVCPLYLPFGISTRKLKKN